MNRSHCDVIQPDLGRVGGLTVAATRHFAGAVPNWPHTEFFHHDFFPSFLRAKLARPEPEMHDGKWSLPDQPGLGIYLNENVVKQCLVRPPTIVE